MNDSQELSPLPAGVARMTDELIRIVQDAISRVAGDSSLSAHSNGVAENAIRGYAAALQHAQQADGEAVAEVYGLPTGEARIDFISDRFRDLPVGTKLYTGPAASSTEQPIKFAEDTILAAGARALCLARGTNPDALHSATDDQVDHSIDGKPYVFSWRRKIPQVRAVLAAVLPLIKASAPASQQGGVPEAIGFRWRLRGGEATGNDDWNYVYHRGPDTFELREGVIENVYVLTTTPSTAGAGSQTLTLTVREIQDLAEYAGLSVSVPDVVDDDELDTEITITECPASGVRCEGEPDDPKAVAYYRYVAYCAEYPDEGCFGLGLEIEPPAAAQEGKQP